jgi:hypothetical protein
MAAQEWEHKVQVVAPKGGPMSGTVNAPMIQEVLDAEGTDGWELVSAVSGGIVVWLLFKRPKPRARQPVDRKGSAHARNPWEVAADHFVHREGEGGTPTTGA